MAVGEEELVRPNYVQPSGQSVKPVQMYISNDTVLYPSDFNYDTVPNSSKKKIQKQTNFS